MTEAEHRLQNRSRTSRRPLAALTLAVLIGLSAQAGSALAQPVPVSEQLAIKLDLARLYLSQDQPERARELLNQALGLARDARERVLIRLSLAQALNQLGQKDAARAQLRLAAAALGPSPDPALLAELAYAERLAGDFKAAASHYRALAALSPHDPQPWLDLGHSLSQSGDAEAARSAYLQALAHYRASASTAPPELAFALRASGAEDEAEALFVALLAADPNRPDYRLELAALRARRGENASAHELLASMSLATLTPDQLRLLADTWLRLDQPARAVAAMAPLIKTEGADPALLLAYADALRLSGGPADEAYARAAQQLETFSAASLRGLAYGLSQTGQPRLALKVLDRLASRETLGPADFATRAQALQLLLADEPGLRGEAIKAWQAAATDPAQRPGAIYNLIQLQAYSQAEALIEPALAALPANESPNPLLLQHLQIIQAQPADPAQRQARIAALLARLRTPLAADDVLSLVYALPQARWLPELERLAGDSMTGLPRLALAHAQLALRTVPRTELARKRVLDAYGLWRLVKNYRPGNATMVPPYPDSELGPEQELLLTDMLLAIEAYDEAAQVLATHATPDSLDVAVRRARLLGTRPGSPDGRPQALALLDAQRQKLEAGATPNQRLLLAQAYYQQREWSTSERLNQQLLALQPTQPDGLLLSGDNLRELGQPGKAAQAYARLLNQEPEHGLARFGLALVERSRDQRLDAAKSFELAAADPSLHERAKALSEPLFRERMAIGSATDYVPMLGISRNDFFLRGAYTVYGLGETRHRLSQRLVSPFSQALDPDLKAAANELVLSDQTPWRLNLDLGGSTFFGQSATWLDFNRLSAGASLDMSWQAPAEAWQTPWSLSLSPSLSWRRSDVIDASAGIASIQSLGLGLTAALLPRPDLRLSLDGQLALGQPDLLLGAFDQGGARAQIEYFPPDTRLGFSSGVSNYLLYDGVGTLQKVQRYANTLLIDWQNPNWLYRGRFDLSPIRGDFEDINLNLEQSLRWFFHENFSAVLGLEVHKYFNQVQRNQSIASLQAGLAWRLPLPAQLPLYLEARARFNSFFDVNEPIRPGFLVFLRSEL